MEDLVQLRFGSYPSWSHFVVRVVLGVVFFAHGAQKVFGWFGGPGREGTIGYFQTQLGIPATAAVLAAFTECFGGISMIVGFLARPVALALVVQMLVAIATVHGRHGFFLNFSMTPGKGHGYEYDLTLIAMALAILLGGAGAVSVDRLVAPWGGR